MENVFVKTDALRIIFMGFAINDFMFLIIFAI